MSRMYILKDGQPIPAGRNMVAEQAQRALGNARPGDPSFQTVTNWDEQTRRDLGIFLNPVIGPRETLKPFQEYGIPVPRLEGGNVVEDFPIKEMSLEAAQDRLINDSAAVRYTHEVGGMIVNGTSLHTDRELRSNYVYNRLRATEDPNHTVNWKIGNQMVPLDAQTLIGLADAVADHVQRCYDNEGVILSSISAASTLDELRAIDITAGYPSYETV